MTFAASIFLDYRLPNATTWFYLAALLAVALFYRFNRVLSLRNWDLVFLFLMVPPLLFLREMQEAKQAALAALQADQARAAGQIARGAALAGGGGPAAALLYDADYRRLLAGSADYAYQRADRNVARAYLWLLICNAYWLIRCLLDLAVARRPPYQANLSPGGLAFLGLALFAVLTVKALLPPSEAIPSATQSVLLERATALARPATEDEAFWVRGGLAVAGHLAVVVGLIAIGGRHFQDWAVGLAAAVLYLLLPYTTYQAWNLHHVLPAALLVGAVAFYRWPTVAGLLLGLAASTVFFPLVLAPLWFSFYRRRGAGRFLLMFLLVLAGAVGYFWWDEGLRPQLRSALGITAAADHPELNVLVANWRAWDPSARPEAEGLWTRLELHYAYRLPLFVAYLVLIVTTTLWPARKTLAHLVALSAALILGVQLWYADAGGIYVSWYLPLLVLLQMRPNLAERFAPAIDPARDWVYLGRRWVGRQWAGKPRQLAA